MSNDTQTVTLSDFLLARIAEDEAVALENPDVWWSFRPNWRIEVETDRDYGEPVAIAVSPTRLRAETDAKRRIVDACDIHADHRALFGGCDDDCQWKAMEYAAKCLAVPYADHPDYREEWRP